MKRKILNKIIFIILSILFMVLIMTIKSNAASISVSTSKSSVSPGETFTATVSVSGGAGKVTATVSNGSGGKTEFLDNGSFSFSCTAGSSGSVTISASGSIADYETETESSKSASKTVTIIQPSTNTQGSSSGSSSSSGGSSTGTSTNKKPKEEVKKSSNNTLSTLAVAEGEITPVFEKDVREYALTIPYETTEVNVTATPSDSKATVAIEGNKDLKEGENTVTVKVTAEDGTVANYIIKVTRARVPLALSSLLVKYENQEGQIIELPLNPVFNFATLEYTLQDLEYWVEKLTVEAVPNIEGATIDIQGADTLQTGENTITITLKILEENTPEGEEPKEETITYTIKVNKLEEPTLIAKISNWFKGIMGTVGSWFNNNQQKIILGALALCIVALIGLSIYIVVDYKKYKDVIAKVKKVTEINANSEMIEEIEQASSIGEEEIIEDNDKDDKPKRGKHF